MPIQKPTDLRPNQVAIELTYPIQTAEGETRWLVMRRPKLRDQINASTGKTNTDNAAIERGLFAGLCEMAPEELDELDLFDYQKLQDTFINFINPTGDDEKP